MKNKGQTYVQSVCMDSIFGVVAVLAMALLWLPTAGLAQNKPSDKPETDKEISKVLLVQYENIVLRKQLIQTQRSLLDTQDAAADAQQRAVLTDMCSEVGITAKDFEALTQVCEVDLTQKKAKRKVPPAVQPTTPATKSK